MPTDSGATDVLGAVALLSDNPEAEQSLPTAEGAEGQEDQVRDHDGEESKEEDKEEGQEQDKEDQTEDEEQEEKYKVKVDGEELEVSLEELQKGYMLEANYRKKTTSLNKDREALNQKALEIDQQLEEAKSLITADIEALNSEDMQRLRDEDPDAYIKKQDEIQAKSRKFDALKQKRDKEHLARQEKIIKKERELLFDSFPEWSGDEVKMQKEAKELLGVMSNLGFSETEINNMTDHRMFVLAHKAQQLEKIQKASLESKKVTPKPKSIKPGVSQSKEDRIKQEKDKRLGELKKTGSRHLAAAILSGK
jgi:hypothetical protein